MNFVPASRQGSSPWSAPLSSSKCLKFYHQGNCSHSRLPAGINYPFHWWSHWGHWMWWHWGTMSRGQENFDDDDCKQKCQYCWSFWRWSHQDITMITSIIALTMMIMIWTRGLVRGCQEVARSRSPCPRPAADKHTPPNALSATCNAMQCNSAYNVVQCNTPHQILM